MNHRDEEIARIKAILKLHPKGMTISEVSDAVSLNRISTARYLENLHLSGQAEMRQHGQAKMYSLCTRIPVSSILNLFGSPILIVDSELCINEVNDRFLQVFSLKRTELIGHNLQYTKLQARFSDDFSKIVKTAHEGVASSSEKSCTIGGKKFWFQIKMVPVNDENGQSRAAIILEDITELKNYRMHLETMVEQRTRKIREENEKLRIEMEGHRRSKDSVLMSRQKYRGLVEEMPSYVCCYEQDLTITYVNNSFCTFMQKESGDLLGKSVMSLLSPENGAIVRTAIAAIAHENPVTTVTLKFCCGDETFRWQQWTIRAFYDKWGKIAEYQAIGIDITDRITIEMKLEKEEKKLDAIIRGSPLPQMVIGKDHRIISWNAAMEAFSDLRADQMIGATTFSNIFYDQDRPMLADLLIDEKYEEIAHFFPENCKKSSYLKDTWEGITFSKIHPGEGCWVFFTAVAIRDDNNEITHVVETMEDLVGYHAHDGTTFIVRSLHRMINKDALSDA